MSEYIREYSPDKVNVNWGGKVPIKGFADGTFITLTRNVPRTETVVGAKGDVGITRTANRTGTLEITLLQNSPSNQIFSAIVNAEDVAGDLYRASMTVEDPSGGVYALAKRCHVQTPADITLGDGQNAKVWSFFVEDMSYLTLPAGLNKQEAVSNVNEAVAAIQTISENLKTITN